MSPLVQETHRDTYRTSTSVTWWFAHGCQSICIYGTAWILDAPIVKGYLRSAVEILDHIQAVRTGCTFNHYRAAVSLEPGRDHKEARTLASQVQRILGPRCTRSLWLTQMEGEEILHEEIAIGHSEREDAETRDPPAHEARLKSLEPPEVVEPAEIEGQRTIPQLAGFVDYSKEFKTLTPTLMWIGSPPTRAEELPLELVGLMGITAVREMVVTLIGFEHKAPRIVLMDEDDVVWRMETPVFPHYFERALEIIDAITAVRRGGQRTFKIAITFGERGDPRDDWPAVKDVLRMAGPRIRFSLTTLRQFGPIMHTRHFPPEQVEEFIDKGLPPDIPDPTPLEPWEVV